MVRDVRNSRIKTAVTVAAALFAVSQVSPVQAQSIMRTPSLHIDLRVPTINPTVAPRINPSIAGRSSVTVIRSPARHRPPPCTLCRAWAYDRRSPTRVIRPTSIRRAIMPIAAATANVSIVPSRTAAAKARFVDQKGQRWSAQQRVADGGNLRSVPNELMAEIDGALTDAQADELARRWPDAAAIAEFSAAWRNHRLVPHHHRRPVETVRRELAGDGSVRSVQLNFRYLCRTRKRRRARAIPRNMRSRSFDCRRPTRLPVA